MLEQLYRQMSRARAFELALADAWHAGEISGELHLGTGEEAIAAAVTSHLGPHDAMALDHRGTPPLVTAGADLRALAAEMLGREDGLCRGRGGHMHLFSREPFAVSSGIVGASGPAGAGFAFAAKRAGHGGLAIAFLGDGAINEGAILESFNLAVAWKLPVVFVCKDNGWAITTRSATVTGGDLIERARGFGLETHDVDGGDVVKVHRVMGEAVTQARAGHAAFVRASCPRLDGHFMGDQLSRVASHLTAAETRETLGASIRGALHGDVSLGERARGLASQVGTLWHARGETKGKASDPMVRGHQAAKRAGVDVERIDAEAAREIDAVFSALRGGVA